MKKILFLVFSLCFFSSLCSAQTASDKSLKELFTLTDMDKMLDSAYSQMDGVFAQMVGQMNVSEEQKPVLDKFFKKYTALVREELSWKKLEQPVMVTYRQVFTEPEVRELIEFYQSPLGRKMLDKMPELMQASMVSMQESMQGLMPKLQELQKELHEELSKTAPAN